MFISVRHEVDDAVADNAIGGVGGERDAGYGGENKSRVGYVAFCGVESGAFNHGLEVRGLVVVRVVDRDVVGSTGDGWVQVPRSYQSQ